MRRHIAFIVAVLALQFLSCSTYAQTASDPVLIENGSIKVTRSDFATELLRLPPDMRGAFATDPKRVATMISNLMTMKQLAAQARVNGIERDPEVQHRLALETDRFLSQLQAQQFEDAAGKDFDARQSQFLLKAKERYAVDKDNFRLPEHSTLSIIRFDVTNRTPQATLALVNETRAKIVAGADFATLATQLSDDAATKASGGSLRGVSPTATDPAVTAAGAALKNVGDVSEPIASRSGYDLVRLDAREPARQMPFDDAKEQIMQDLRKRYIDDQREARINDLRNDPKIKVNTPAVDALIVHIPDPIMLRPFVPK